MKILKSWGNDGQVVVSLDADDPEDLKIEEPVFIEFDGLPVPFFIEKVQSKGSRFTVKFEDVDTLEGAEELVGRTARYEKEEDEEDDSLIGFVVKNAADGSTVGRIVDYADYSGNVCITVDCGGREVLLPLHEDLIREVTDTTLTLVIPEGLL